MKIILTCQVSGTPGVPGPHFENLWFSLHKEISISEYDMRKCTSFQIKEAIAYADDLSWFNTIFPLSKSTLLPTTGLQTSMKIKIFLRYKVLKKKKKVVHNRYSIIRSPHSSTFCRTRQIKGSINTKEVDKENKRLTSQKEAIQKMKRLVK